MGSTEDDTATDSNYIDKKRLVEMYVYQEKKYEAYLSIFNQLTFYCVILLILAILKKRFILSDRFTKILIFSPLEFHLVIIP